MSGITITADKAWKVLFDIKSNKYNNTIDCKPKPTPSCKKKKKVTICEKKEKKCDSKEYNYKNYIETCKIIDDVSFVYTHIKAEIKIMQQKLTELNDDIPNHDSTQYNYLIDLYKNIIFMTYNNLYTFINLQYFNCNSIKLPIILPNTEESQTRQIIYTYKTCACVTFSKNTCIIDNMTIKYDETTSMELFIGSILFDINSCISISDINNFTEYMETINNNIAFVLKRIEKNIYLLNEGKKIIKQIKDNLSCEC
jgi:hypothetical protein